MPSDPRRIAMLIDGDNAYMKYLERMVAEAGRHGTVAIRRIYGGRDVLASWEKCIQIHKFEPVCVKGKNYADFALAMDAALMLDSNEVDGFCMVSSDKDFAGMVHWLRNKGAYVAGIGASDKDITEFEEECDAFAHFEDLPPPADPDPTIREIILGWKDAVRKAIRMHASDGGWANMADIGNTPTRDPRLDYGAYCHGGLKSLVESCPEEFETQGNEVRLLPGTVA